MIKNSGLSLLGLIGDVEVCNVVDPRVAVRLGIP